ncbi:MAG TPA: response regulator transcription factor [Pedococcus sp.]|jgi:DNA-binding response OmpR family regulator
MSVAERVAVVVEDDPDIRGLIVHSLTMQGFTVHPAPDGQTGIALTSEHRPDLITIDLGLPDLEGIEVCRRIRSTTDAYIVMISARASELDRLMGLETGADDYLVKPFSPRELQARVNAMFRRPRSSGAPGGPEVATGAAVPQPATDAVGADAPSAASGSGDLTVDHEVIAYGKLEVDIDGRLVRVEGDEVPLTRTEFDLMATMIRAPRRVWTRETLLRQVWGEEWGVDHHLVEVHVGNLRRKLGGGTSRFIRTIRGVGYRIETPEESAASPR